MINIFSHSKKIKLAFSLVSFLVLLIIFYGSNYANDFNQITYSNNILSDRFSYADLTKVASNSLNVNQNVLGSSSVNNEARSLPVVLYHGIVNEINDGEDVKYSDFVEQLRLLKQNGYSTVTLEQAEKFLNGEIKLKDRSFLLTFDDGRKDSYYPVDDVLKELNYNAVIYIINERTKPTDSFHLSEDEIKEMLKTGRWEIGSHSDQAHKNIQIDELGTQGHWLSNKLWLVNERRLETDGEYKTRIVADLNNSKESLSKRFGVNVNSYAIPFGDFGQNDSNYSNSESVVLEESRKVYSNILYQPWGEIGFRNYPKTDSFMIRRYSVHSDTTSEILLNTVNAGNDKDLPYSFSFLNKFDLINTWGSYEVDDSSITVKAKDNTSGASIYLNGSEAFTDVQINITATISDDTDTISLFVLGDRHGDYAYCNFSRNGVGFFEKYEGKQIKGNYWQRRVYLDKDKPIKLSISQKDRIISCKVNDFEMVSDTTRYIIDNGGMVGLNIWSSKGNGYAEASITSFSAEKLQ